MDTDTGILARIRAQNLGAYERMPSRVDEDSAQEGQIAQDYQGRLAFELLQNADDAMVDGEFTERISFRLTDEALEVANSGRALTDADVAGLCGTGFSSKTEAPQRRRATIGHKGMGFKSVLEITNRPEVISDTIGFRLDATASEPAIRLALEAAGVGSPRRVPTMRLPWPLDDQPHSWSAAREEGMHVLFRFPLRPDLTREQRQKLAKRLLELPITAVLFLKHLDDVEVDVRAGGVVDRFRWRLRRHLRGPDGWVPVPGFESSGVYRVSIRGEDGKDVAFLIAHDADVEIGDHRGGLSGVGWEDIELSEVSLAAPWPLTAGLAAEAARFHVFLPTQEFSPYPLLVNGAFRTDLSRQEIRVSDDAGDYNRHLIRAAADVLRDRLLPSLFSEGVSVADALTLLDRSRATGARSADSAASAFHEAVKLALAGTAFIPGEGGLELALEELVVPPRTTDPRLGRSLREVLPADANHDGRWLPDQTMCEGPTASILADLGARALGLADAASVLEGADAIRSALRPHPRAGERLSVDPVLDVLARLWNETRGRDRAEFEAAVRACQLFPVAIVDGSVRRVSSEGAACYYPPRSLLGEVPLAGLKFMLQQVCWGSLTPPERNDILRAELPAWQGLFGIHEFRFLEVMTSSVFPALQLDVDQDGAALRVALQDLDRIAAICQLAGRSVDPQSPLPFERYGTSRGLFNLARLRLPCRPRPNGIERWEPAFRIYFGQDWIREASIESVLATLEPATVVALDIPMLAPPSAFAGRLAKYKHLAQAADDASSEVTAAEDEDAALESDEGDRWLNFLTWLGVNRVVRPVGFHDVAEPGGAWPSTDGLTQPRGAAFSGLGGIWDEYAREVTAALGPEGETSVRYFYGLHDLERIEPILQAANRDSAGAASRALFGHLAHGWPQLSPHLRLSVVVTSDRAIGRRNPPKPNEDELRHPLDNFWMYRLRRASWVPSTHGPRPAGRVWKSSPEIGRRFGRRGANAGDLIAVLETDADAPAGRVDALATALGVRNELSPATFGDGDARALLERIAVVFSADAADGKLDERRLRDVVRPAYRELIELLSSGPIDDDDSEGDPVVASLSDAPVLVHDGAEGYRFVAGREALYISRPGTRDRLGQQSLEAFVLEGSVTARRPLRKLGIETLEDVLEWGAQPGDLSLDDEQLTIFREGLANLAPYVLSRLRVDRSDERTAARDANRLRTLLGALQPVQTLALECRLRGTVLLSTDARDTHVSEAPGRGMTAFVRWGERGWPPTSTEADALATVLVDALGAGAFEAFLALVAADGRPARERLLRYAGASTNLDEFKELLGEEPERPGKVDNQSVIDVRTTSDEGGNWLGSDRRTTTGERGRVPLYRPDDLLIEGTPVIVHGVLEGLGQTAGAPVGGPGGPGTGYGRGGTDLDELNAVGMWVALNFERHRLRLAGVATAEIFERASPDPDALVFDVSTDAAIRAANDGSSAFRAALDRLAAQGLSRSWPGFDILTLDPGFEDHVGRMIELKSSGIDAQTQGMTWNEWKTARDGRLRERFYLYLVSNLRSDLGDRPPHIRAVQDPFGSLWGQKIIETTVERSVQFNLRQFELAVDLPLRVKMAEPREQKIDPD